MCQTGGTSGVCALGQLGNHSVETGLCAVVSTPNYPVAEYARLGKLLPTYLRFPLAPTLLIGTLNCPAEEESAAEWLNQQSKSEGLAARADCRPN